MTTSDERATSVGQTGGLPGDNADPRTEQISDDEMADTVSGIGTAEVGEGDEDAAVPGPTS